MRKRSGQVHSRESSATLQLTVSLLYPSNDKRLQKVTIYGIKECIDISNCVQLGSVRYADRP